MQAGDPMVSLVSDDMDLFTVLLRARVQLADSSRNRPEGLAWLLHEVLPRCQSGVEEPDSVLEVVGQIARAAPGPGRQAVIEALERGVDDVVLEGLVELLASLGTDLGAQEQISIERLRQGTAAEKVRAMHLLCALGPTTDDGVAAILETDVGRLWRLEWKRVEALLRQRQRALPLVIAALAHAEEGVRARAEAVLEAMGPEAHEAVPALLAMPAWEGPNGDWPSPALYTVGEAGRSHLKEALEHPSPVVRGRAELVLDTLTSQPE